MFRYLQVLTILSHLVPCCTLLLNTPSQSRHTPDDHLHFPPIARCILIIRRITRTVLTTGWSGIRPHPWRCEAMADNKLLRCSRHRDLDPVEDFWMVLAFECPRAAMTLRYICFMDICLVCSLTRSITYPIFPIHLPPFFSGTRLYVQRSFQPVYLPEPLALADVPAISATLPMIS